MRWLGRARLAVALVVGVGLLGLTACQQPKKPPPVYECDAGVSAAGQPHETPPPPPTEPLAPDEAGEAAKAAVAEADAEVHTADGRVPLVMVEQTPAGPEITTVPVASDAEAEAVAEQAAAAGNLVSVEPDSIVTADAGPPNDPHFPKQYALNQLRFVATWENGYSGPRSGLGQRVAVLDSGVQASHEDLQGKLHGQGATFGGYGPATQDVYGHGTRVAGIIAARTNNSMGIAGAAPAARIIPVRVLDNQGRGFSSHVAQGIRWAADNGAHVINLSLGGPTPSDALHQAVQYAVFFKHVPVISASGNTGKCGGIAFPAAYGDVLAVGAVDSANRWAGFSTTAPYVRVVASGVGIWSTTVGSTKYGSASGTSFSAPYVAAAAAIVRARHPSFSATQVYDRLIGTATDLGPPGWDPHFGWGLVNVQAAAG